MCQKLGRPCIEEYYSNDDFSDEDSDEDSYDELSVAFDQITLRYGNIQNKKELIYDSQIWNRLVWRG